MASENEDPVPSSSGAGLTLETEGEHVAQPDVALGVSAQDVPPPMPFEPGHVIHGKYELLKPLGSGGVGYVVAARHIGFDDLVALKFLRPEFATHQEAVSRFTIEARASFRLRSEHVARMLDVDIYAGVPFIVMELLEGTDLRNLLETRRVLDLTPSIDFLLQACEALAAAHAIGVIHRDIKPENLFLLGNGAPGDHLKVLDFGISKVAVRGDSMRTNHALTRMAVGTPPYMSPEQVRASSALDARSDIWSVGCVLYELLTGTAPFDRVSLMQACAAVLEDEPSPPRDLNGRIPQGLSDVIMRCLRKDPNERYADVADLAEALSHFGSERMASYPARCRAHLAGEGQGRRSTPPSFLDERRPSTRQSGPLPGNQAHPPRSITVRLESHAPLTRRENTGPNHKSDAELAEARIRPVSAVMTSLAVVPPVANENLSDGYLGSRDGLPNAPVDGDELDRVYVPRRRTGQALAWGVPIIVGGLLATYLATAEQRAHSSTGPSVRSTTETVTDVAPALGTDGTAQKADVGERPQADKSRRATQDVLPSSGSPEIPQGATVNAAASTEELAAAGAGPRATSLSDAAAQAEHDAAHGSNAKKVGSASGKAKARTSTRSATSVKAVEPASVARPQADPDVGF